MIKPIKQSNKGNVWKTDVLKYLNKRHRMAGLGVQGMFLPTPYGSTSTECVYMFQLVQLSGPGISVFTLSLGANSVLL